jgi:hypothetical protein
MQYRILKDGKGVGYFHITESDYGTYNGVIVLASGNKPSQDIFPNKDTVGEVKAAFAANHGGDGYELEEPGASL